MAPRQIAARLTQRAMKSASVAALALGLTATVFAPLSAQAAPLPSDVDSSGRPDLSVSVARSRSAQGDPITFAMDVRNVGSAPADRVVVRLEVPFDTSGWILDDWTFRVEKEDRTASSFAGCMNVRNAQSTFIGCQLKEPVEAGTFQRVRFTMPNPGPGEYKVMAQVDHLNLVPESDEQNNVRWLTTFID